MLDAPAALDTEIQLLERRHAEHPEGRFFVPLAERYRTLGDPERAERLLREGLQRLPDYVSARVVLGRCLADVGRTDQAASEFRAVLGADPQNLLALRGLGDIAATAGLQEEAASWYAELLAVDPMNEDARRALDALSAEPAVAEPDPLFEAVYEEVFEQAPEETESDEESGEELVTETIAELYSRQGFHDRAAEVYRELLRRRGEDPILRQRLSEAELLGADTPARSITIAEALTELLAWPHGSPR